MNDDHRLIRAEDAYPSRMAGGALREPRPGENPLLTAIRMPANDNTKRAYKLDVERFFRVKEASMITLELIRSMTVDDVVHYRNRMVADRLCNATVCRRLSFVRRLYKALCKQGYVQYNPVDPELVEFPSRTADQLTTASLTEEELLKMLAVPDDTWFGRRTKCILAFAITMGLRRAELSAITTDMIMQDEQGQPTFEVPVKGGTQRICVIPEMAHEPLRLWMKARGTKRGPIFVSVNGNEIGGQMIWNIVHECASLAGVQREERRNEKPPTADGETEVLIDKVIEAGSPDSATPEKKPRKRWRVHPHSFRASCIKFLLRKGWTVADVQKYIGHKDPSTTLRYTLRDAVPRHAMGASFDFLKPGAQKENDARNTAGRTDGGKPKKRL